MPGEMNGITSGFDSTITERDQRIAEQEAEIKRLTKVRLKHSFATELAKKGLPEAFADVIDVDSDDDAQEALRRAEDFNKVFSKAVKTAVNQRFPEGAEAHNAQAKETRINKVQISAIKDPNKRQRAIAENMDLFTFRESKKGDLIEKYNISDNPHIARRQIMQIENSADRLMLLQKYKHLF